MRIMYDAVTPGDIPGSALLVAGYVDGAYANLVGMRARFPHAVVVGIAVFASTDAGTVLDVETGDATPAQAPGWVVRRRAAGVDPTVYCNDSTWPQVLAAFRAAGVAEPHWWIAHYDGIAVLPVGAVAKQFQDAGPYDLSVVAGYWPGVDPAPVPPVPAPPATTKENAVIMIHVQTDAQGNGPGIFLLAGGVLHHLAHDSDVAALKAAGVPGPVVISQDTYASMAAGK